MISEELLSEVTNMDVVNMWREYEFVKFVTYECEIVSKHCISIYELYHMCKLWANEKGFEIVESGTNAYVSKIGDQMTEDCFSCESGDSVYNIDRVYECANWILGLNIAMPSDYESENT